MKALRLREQSDEELKQMQRETSDHVVELRVKKAMGDSTEQPLKIRTLRRELARVNTVIRERELKSHG